MKKLALVLTVALMASPAMAAILTPHVAGDFQGWDAGADPMTETAPGSGIFTKTFAGMAADSRHEFKITDGTWGTSFPGPNSWLFADAGGSITISYDINTYADGWSPTTERLGLSADPLAGWTVVGGFQGWNNANPATQMTHLGGGIYKYTQTFVPGNYEWKAAVTGSWDSISWDNRSVNTANWSFTTDAVNHTVDFWVDSYAGTARFDLVPEPTTLTLLGLGLVALLRRRR